MQIFCDNMAVVEVLTTMRARDHTLAACTRNIWLLSSLYNIHFTFSHIAGKENVSSRSAFEMGSTTEPMGCTAGAMSQPCVD